MQQAQAAKIKALGDWRGKTYSHQVARLLPCHFFDHAGVGLFDQGGFHDGIACA
jgi:hypothetical protein